MSFKFLEFFKGRVRLVSVIIMGFLVIGYFASKFFFNTGQEAVTPAITVPVQRGAIEVTISGTGTVQPTVTRAILSNSTGAIDNINFTNGQVVKKGDLLFQVDTNESNKAIQSEIKRAELELKQAELEYNSNLEQVKKQSIVAPISGQITSIEVQKNQEVQRNSVIAVVADTSKLVLKLPMAKEALINLQIGQKAEVRIPSLDLNIEGKLLKVQGGEAVIEVNNSGNLTQGILVQGVVHTSEGTEEGFATLEWKDFVAVRSEVSGAVSQIKVSNNDLVKKGQEIAFVSMANISYQLASQELKIDQSKLALETSKKKQVDNKIYAPIDGIINLGSVQSGASNQGSSQFGNSSSTTTSGRNYWQVGDEVSPGQALATVTNNSEMVVTVSVDEVDISKVELGQEATITIDALQEAVFYGQVVEIANEGTQQNGVATFDVTVSIVEPKGLKTNMTANVEIMVAKKEGALLLPIEAIQERQGRKFVILARQEGKEATVETETSKGGLPANMKVVETGLYNESMIEIIKGLEEGEMVTVTVLTSGGNGSNSGRSGGMPMFGGMRQGVRR